jgi:hypothetical protein
LTIEPVHELENEEPLLFADSDIVSINHSNDLNTPDESNNAEYVSLFLLFLQNNKMSSM